MHSFVFASVNRTHNQIRQSVLVDRFNVKIMGREGAWGDPGISHNTVEGLGSTRVLPNLVIVNPADAVEATAGEESKHLKGIDGVFPDAEGWLSTALSAHLTDKPRVP